MFVAWMRMMGADSVDYHEANVANRVDDHAGAALDYYGSRGETPLVWAGSGAHLLGVEGAATTDAYRAVFGPGGACLPRTGARLVSTRRPGIELVVSPHKSVAELGVLGWAEAMHAIVDAERDATLAYLDRTVKEIGGRRGERATPTPTAGLTWVTSRHATTRAGDPQVHDHVLVANVVWMRDQRAGWKGVDTAFVRDHLHAATAIGRMAAARKAVELGFAIEPDAGRSGRLGGWRIAGMPDGALAVHAKRSAQIDSLIGADASPRARGIAAHTHRDPKRHQPVEMLLGRWRAELSDAGHPPSGLIADVQTAARQRPAVLDRLDDETTARLVAETLGVESRLAEIKVFDRSDAIVAVAPRLHGLPVSELDRVVDLVIAHAECVPLIGVAGARTQAYATFGVLAAEARIAELADTLASQPAAQVSDQTADRALAAVEEHLGGALTVGQRRAALGLLTSGAGLEVVVGVAGSGKTAMLGAVGDGFTACGFTVVGTATSGQAARGLADGADLSESRTVASLCWRLAHDRIRLSRHHVMILDEAGMTDDPDLGRLLAAVERAGAKLIMIGDDRQLGAVGPGGGLGALRRRQPQRMWELTDNVRQTDPGEQQALVELRAGRVDRAVDWYDKSGRIIGADSREEAISAMVAAWAADITGGRDSLLLAWRRDDVDDLNQRARHAYAAMGLLAGPEIEAPGGWRYQAGDQVLMLTSGLGGAWVTSERATITTVNPRDGSVGAVTGDGRRLHLTAEQTGADRLTHAYAVTVHRSQGSTSDTAHVLEDGGGRELAYVAMSRARNVSRVYVPAFNQDEAVEHLRWAWTSERRQRWAHDQGQPQPGRATIVEQRDRLVGHVSLQAAATARAANRRLDAVAADLADLHAGKGRWADTPAGTAARAVRAAEANLWEAQRQANDHQAGIWQRRKAARSIPDLQADLDHARKRWAHHGRRAADQLSREVENLRDRPHGASIDRHAWLADHPHIAEQLDQLDQELASKGAGHRRGHQRQQTRQRRRPDIDIGL